MYLEQWLYKFSNYYIISLTIWWLYTGACSDDIVQICRAIKLLINNNRANIIEENITRNNNTPQWITSRYTWTFYYFWRHFLEDLYRRLNINWVYFTRVMFWATLRLSTVTIRNVRKPMWTIIIALGVSGKEFNDNKAFF